MRYLDDLFEFSDSLTDRADTDRILEIGNFSNIFRTDDDVTRWFYDNILSHVSEENAVLASVAFRMFNNIRAGAVLQPYLLGDEPWNENQIMAAFHGVGPMFPGINAPPGTAESAILRSLRPVQRLGPQIGLEGAEFDQSMQDIHRLLCGFAHVSAPLAYEVVLDLRHTSVLAGAEDIDSWAYVSPQVCRGMGFVVSDDPLEYVFGHERTEQGMLSMMKFILESSHPRPWEMSEVESSLHEFNKYRTAQSGGPILLK